MTTINNPIIPGMAPDPAIIRVDDTYYLAASTFHWQPAVQFFEFKDLNDWQLVDYALKDGEVNLRGQVHQQEYGHLIFLMIKQLKNIGWLILIWSIWVVGSLTQILMPCLRIVFMAHGQNLYL